MMAANEIVARLREAPCETDLGLIYDIWRQQTHDREVMRSADHLAVRKAAVALERVADVLARRLTPQAANGFRTLPEIKPTTRFRKTPQRLWLEIGQAETEAQWQAQTVLFVEFSKTGARLGLRLPLNDTPLDRNIIRALNPFKTTIPLDAANWCLERRKAPAAQAACPADVNAWLAARHKTRQINAAPLTLNKCCSQSRPTLHDLITGLNEAATLIQGAIGGDLNLPDPMIPRRETLAAAMI